MPRMCMECGQRQVYGEEIHCGPCKSTIRMQDLAEQAAWEAEAERERQKKEEGDRGDCARCGKVFKEKYRVFPMIGQTWTGPAERFSRQGMCPQCFGLWIEEKNNVRIWGEEEWLSYISEIDSTKRAKKAIGILEKSNSDLTEHARKKYEELELAEKIKAETDPDKLQDISIAVTSSWSRLSRDAAEKADIKRKEIWDKKKKKYISQIQSEFDTGKLETLVQETAGVWPELVAYVLEQKEKIENLKAEREEKERIRIQQEEERKITEAEHQKEMELRAKRREEEEKKKREEAETLRRITEANEAARAARLKAEITASHANHSAIEGAIAGFFTGIFAGLPVACNVYFTNKQNGFLAPWIGTVIFVTFLFAMIRYFWAYAFPPKDTY